MTSLPPIYRWGSPHLMLSEIQPKPLGGTAHGSVASEARTVKRCTPLALPRDSDRKVPPRSCSASWHKGWRGSLEQQVRIHGAPGIERSGLKTVWRSFLHRYWFHFIRHCRVRFCIWSYHPYGSVPVCRWWHVSRWKADRPAQGLRRQSHNATRVPRCGLEHPGHLAIPKRQKEHGWTLLECLLTQNFSGVNLPFTLFFSISVHSSLNYNLPLPTAVLFEKRSWWFHRCCGGELFPFSGYQPFSCTRHFEVIIISLEVTLIYYFMYSLIFQNNYGVPTINQVVLGDWGGYK